MLVVLFAIRVEPTEDFSPIEAPILAETNSGNAIEASLPRVFVNPGGGDLEQLGHFMDSHQAAIVSVLFCCGRAGWRGMWWINPDGRWMRVARQGFRRRWVFIIVEMLVWDIAYCKAWAMSSVGRWVLAHTGLEAVFHGVLLQFQLERLSFRALCVITVVFAWKPGLKLLIFVIDKFQGFSHNVRRWAVEKLCILRKLDLRFLIEP
jgi:hypothetical protein